MLLLEFATLFFAVPSLLAVAGTRIPALPVLWLVSVFCWLYVRRDPDFDRRQLWDAAAKIPKGWTGVLIPFSVAAASLIVAVHHWAPRLFLDLPRKNPILWALILCLYPVFSVIPQGLVYRVFFAHRYAPLFASSRTLVIAGGVAFAYMHVVFRNAWAMGLSLPAGMLFLARYRETRSLMVSSVEHALYGCMIFTIGLGAYFYQGPMPKF